MIAKIAQPKQKEEIPRIAEAIGGMNKIKG